MANIWIILYPYSSSRRVRKLAALGILSLLSLYIFIFLKTAADIEKYKLQLAEWNSRIIRTLTFAKVEQPPDWQNVGIENSTFAVYSAFSFQQDSPNEVIIVGSHPHFLRDEGLKCRFYYDAGHQQNEVIIVNADYELIPGWKRGNAGTIIKCSLQTTANTKKSTIQNTFLNETGSNPTYVSILSGNRTEHGNRLPIQYKTNTGDVGSDKYLFDFSVCVLPLNDSYNSVIHFLEWLEYYKMMGVKQFSFYNLSLGSNYSCVIDHLLNRDHFNETKYQVINYHWNFPMSVKKKGFGGLGESSALMDCHLRHKGISKYVAVINLNEFITPDFETISNFQQLINSVVNVDPNPIMNAQQGASTSSFADFWFRKRYEGRDNESVEDTTMKCALLSSNPLEHRVCQNLLSIKPTYRDEREDEVSGSAKYIMIPERVRFAGANQVNLLEAGYKTKRVPETIAYIRQYDKRIKQGATSSNQNSLDQVNLKAALVLAKNVATNVLFFMKKCGLKEDDILKPIN